MAEYETDILKDFDLSIIMPFYRKFDAFSKTLPLNANFLQRNGIEVIIVLDEPSQKAQMLGLIDAYPLINWIIMINNNDHHWRNPAKAINVGIKTASKKYIMVCSPESLFKTDAIFRLRSIVEIYDNAFAIGKVYFSSYEDHCLENKISMPYGSIMVERSYLINVGCYEEEHDEWGGEDDHIRSKLEYYGYKKMFTDDAILIHLDESPLEIIRRNKKPRNIPDETYKYSLRPRPKDLSRYNWGKDFNEKIFDYRSKQDGYKNCLKYLSQYKDFELTHKSLFDKTRKVVALLHTYNEESNIEGAIKHLEEIADGIILLDDDSSDNTFDLAKSTKLICKIKKTRKVKNELNELENKNIMLDIVSFVSCDWIFVIDADERFHLFGKTLHQILKTQKKACSIYLIHLWDTEDFYRTDVPEVSPISLPGVLHRWRFFKNIGRCQIIGNAKFHFKHTPFQVHSTLILPILILHYGMLSRDMRQKKYINYISNEKVENFSNYSYFLDQSVETSKVADLIGELPNYFDKNFE